MTQDYQIQGPVPGTEGKEAGVAGAEWAEEVGGAAGKVVRPQPYLIGW